MHATIAANVTEQLVARATVESMHCSTTLQGACAWRSGIDHSTLAGAHVERWLGPALPPVRPARSRATMPPLTGAAPNAALPRSHTTPPSVTDRRTGIRLGGSGSRKRACHRESEEAPPAKRQRIGSASLAQGSTHFERSLLGAGAGDALWQAAQLFGQAVAAACARQPQLQVQQLQVQQQQGQLQRQHQQVQQQQRQTQQQQTQLQ